MKIQFLYKNFILYLYVTPQCFHSLTYKIRVDIRLCFPHNILCYCSYAFTLLVP